MTASAPRGWQRMLSGRRLEILDPSPLDVELDDIAHGIARVARWNGQTKGSHPYSVAQHSCLVEEIACHLDPGLSTPARLAALLHDAPEYVIGDLVTPLKVALGPGVRAIEARLQAAIHLAFALPAELPETQLRLIKRADRTAAWLEATSLAGFTEREARATFGAPERLRRSVQPLLDPWPADRAEAEFRSRVVACRSG